MIGKKLHHLFETGAACAAGQDGGQGPAREGNPAAQGGGAIDAVPRQPSHCFEFSKAGRFLVFEDVVHLGPSRDSAAGVPGLQRPKHHGRAVKHPFALRGDRHRSWSRQGWHRLSGELARRGLPNLGSQRDLAHRSHRALALTVTTQESRYRKSREAGFLDFWGCSGLAFGLWLFAACSYGPFSNL